ncbi:hypothetical protein HK101_008289 [Irineochytrium annulatum]|nr:hypothetical protein HK101_008289 [Irineochytrium annulatum]
MLAFFDEHHSDDDEYGSVVSDDSTVVGFGFGGGFSGEGAGMDHDLMTQMATFTSTAILAGPQQRLPDPLAPEYREQEESEAEHFTVEEFGPALNMQFYDEHAGSARHGKLNLFEKMRPRQFFIGQVLHRERKQRKVSWDELFLDLIFIAVLDRVAHIIRSASDISSDLLNKATLTFIPIWLTWTFIQVVSNRFGVKGFGSRLILWGHMLFLSGLGINCAFAWSDDVATNTSTLYVITFLCHRVLVLATNVIVGVLNPKFKSHLVLTNGCNMLGAVPFIVGIFCANETRMALWWLGFAIDTFAFVIVIVIFKMFPDKSMWRYRVAVNIEHATERWAGLTMVILGEMVIGLLWASDRRDMSTAYLATTLGLFVAISFSWLYFDVDSQNFTHAIRRSAISGITWQVLHFPLHVCLVATGSALAILVKMENGVVFPGPQGSEHGSEHARLESVIGNDTTAPLPDSGELEPPLVAGDGIPASLCALWFGGLAASLFCITCIGLTHKAHDHDARIPRRYRAIVRFAIAVGFAVAGALAQSLHPLTSVAIPAAVFFALTVFEE